MSSKTDIERSTQQQSHIYVNTLWTGGLDSVIVQPYYIYVLDPNRGSTEYEKATMKTIFMRLNQDPNTKAEILPVKDVPRTEFNSFDSSPIASCTLYVLEGSVAKYQNYSRWSEFGSIKTLGDRGIMATTAQASAVPLQNHPYVREKNTTFKAAESAENSPREST